MSRDTELWLYVTLFIPIALFVLSVFQIIQYGWNIGVYALIFSFGYLVAIGFVFVTLEFADKWGI